MHGSAHTRLRGPITAETRSPTANATRYDGMGWFSEKWKLPSSFWLLLLALITAVKPDGTWWKCTSNKTNFFKGEISSRTYKNNYIVCNLQKSANGLAVKCHILNLSYSSIINIACIHVACLPKRGKSTTCTSKKWL